MFSVVCRSNAVSSKSISDGVIDESVRSTDSPLFAWNIQRLCTNLIELYAIDLQKKTEHDDDNFRVRILETIETASSRTYLHTPAQQHLFAVVRNSFSRYSGRFDLQWDSIQRPSSTGQPQ